jgi:hypothetical protein
MWNLPGLFWPLLSTTIPPVAASSTDTVTDEEFAEESIIVPLGMVSLLKYTFDRLTQVLPVSTMCTCAQPRLLRSKRFHNDPDMLNSFEHLMEREILKRCCLLSELPGPFQKLNAVISDPFYTSPVDENSVSDISKVHTNASRDHGLVYLTITK